VAERSSLVRLQEIYDIDVDWRGFELHPEVPPGGMAPEDMFGKERIAQFRSHMKQFAKRFGVPIGDSNRVPNTRRALAMTEYAREQGKLEPLRDNLMEAHFKDGRDIESDDVLGQAAEFVGIDRTEALHAADNPDYLGRIDRAREEATQMQITGIPTLFVGDTKIVGCQPYETLAAAADRAGIAKR
jgi:predicted DsbA family dithiol-disulfide isomerase